MVKVVWTQRALSDLEDIGDYIAKDSSKYAKLTLEKIIESAFYIETNPLIGKVTPESNNPTIREIVIGNYRVIYEIRSEIAIYILTIAHFSRLFSNRNLK